MLRLLVLDLRSVEAACARTFSWAFAVGCGRFVELLGYIPKLFMGGGMVLLWLRLIGLRPGGCLFCGFSCDSKAQA